MTDARKLVEEIRRDLKPLDRAIREHPYPAALAAGVVPVEALVPFLGHQYHIVTSDLRSMAVLVHRFGHTRARDFFAGMLQGELAGREALLAMGRKLGLPEADLAGFQVTPEGFAYATYMAWQATYASAAEFTCGILVNFDAWGFNCGRMSEGLRERHGFGPEEVAFLDAFANMPADVRRGAQLFQGYEKMFWDTMARLAGVSP
jgi:hypothetical protein